MDNSVEGKQKIDFARVRYFILVSVLLFIVPLTDLVFLIIFLVIDYSFNNLSLFFSNIASIIASSVVAISASLAFYKNVKNIDSIIMTRIVIVVLGTVIHFTLETILRFLDASPMTRFVISIIFLVFDIFMVFITLKHYKCIDDHRKEIEKKAEESYLNNLTEHSQIINSIKSGTVDDKKFDLEGKNEN